MIKFSYTSWFAVRVTKSPILTRSLNYTSIVVLFVRFKILLQKPGACKIGPHSSKPEQASSISRAKLSEHAVSLGLSMRCFLQVSLDANPENPLFTVSGIMVSRWLGHSSANLVLIFIFVKDALIDLAFL